MARTKKIFNEWRAKYRTTLKGKAQQIFDSAKFRSKKSGINFNLDIKWVEKKLERKFCEISQLPFCFKSPRRGYQQNPFAPSLERIDPKDGYIKSNVKVVIWAVNICKWNWTVKDFKKIIKAIYKGLKNYE